MSKRRGRGTWLILAAAGGQDHEATAIALAAIKAMRGQVRLSIRLLGESEELRAWHVAAIRRLGHPLWLIMQDGNLAGVQQGRRTAAELVAALEAARARATPS